MVQNKNKTAIRIFNDDTSSFHHVIATLSAVCKMSTIQAEQIAYIIHHKGHYDILRDNGIDDQLNKVSQLVNSKLKAEICY